MVSDGPVRVDGELLRLSRPFASAAFPLAELAGVGLWFQYRKPVSGWYLMLWTTDGTEHAPRGGFIWRAATWSRVLVNAHNWTSKELTSQPLPGEEGLGSTPPAVLAAQVYAGATEIQGPQGPLVQLHYETRQPGRWHAIPTYACWSPKIGSARFAAV